MLWEKNLEVVVGHTLVQDLPVFKVQLYWTLCKACIFHWKLKFPWLRLPSNWMAKFTWTTVDSS